MSLQITQLPDNTIEIYDLFEEGGTQVTCKPDGTIELVVDTTIRWRT